MEFRTLKHTDLRVSRLCFGTMTFGKPVQQKEATQMVDLCLEAGVNFIDTANMYQTGIAEEILGRAIEGRRDQILLASKVRAKMGEEPDQKGLSKRAVCRAVEDSLARLRTDYLDLYFLHQPDDDVPIEETLDAMEQLIEQGKVRFAATSNYAAWQVVEMLTIAARKGWRPAATSQMMYNLLARGIEQEFVPMTKTFDIGLLAYNPLAGGLLTGKHQSNLIPQGGRFDANQMYQDRYWHERTFEAVNALKLVAARAGRSLPNLAFTWLLHHTATDVVILGASRIEQLAENLRASSAGPLSADVVEELDQIWRRFRGPVPVYNR